MTTYYIDMAQTYEATYTDNGTASGTPWGGAAGIQRAIASLAAGETAYVANAATATDNKPLTDLWKVPLAATTNCDAGDLLENQTRAGTLRIAVVVAADYVLGELVSGAFQNGDNTTPDGGTTTLAIDAAPTQPGLLIHDDFATDGTGGNPITLEGVASDWSTAERVYLDGDSTCDGISTDGLSGWTLENITVNAPSSYGFDKLTAGDIEEGWAWKNFEVINAGVDGCHNLHRFRFSLMCGTYMVNPTADGTQSTPYSSRVQYHVSVGAGIDGISSLSTSTVLTHSLILDSGQVGIRISNSGSTITNCIIDGNGAGGSGGSGISITSGSSQDVLTIANNRITNNGAGASGYGIEVAGGEGHSWHVDENVYADNETGNVTGVSLGDNDIEATDAGYVDAAAGNYALRSNAAGRRVAHSMSWTISGTSYTTTFYTTAGLAPDDWPGARRLV